MISVSLIFVFFRQKKIESDEESSDGVDAGEENALSAFSYRRRN
jgi:hypothetical protein